MRERHDRDRHERDRRGGGGEKPNLMTALRVLTALETLLGSLAPQVRKFVGSSNSLFRKLAFFLNLKNVVYSAVTVPLP